MSRARTPVTLRIPADQRIWFISDLHIGDGTPADVFFGKDRQLSALVKRVEREGSILVILGDAIDFHQAWTFARVLAAHPDLFSDLSRCARAGRVYYVVGNHDYEINLFQEMLQFKVCDELLIGDDIRAVHGFQYDPFMKSRVGDGHGWSTTIHHLAERYLRTWLRIPLGEFYTKGNRLMFWLAHKVALVANLYARGMRGLGFTRSADAINRYLDYWAQGNLGDSMGMFRPILDHLRTGRFRYIVCGHSHVPGIVRDGEGDQATAYINTGSWTFASSHYVVWDGQDFAVRDWMTGRSIGAEMYESLLDGTIYDKDFWQWWRENYMGLFRFREGEERKGRLRGWESYIREYQHLAGGLLPQGSGPADPTG
ncbi:MAG: metallophosphoesterase [Deltaproteobacteria bacterium]|nr:metallophosphoesterase [Deltaproteobacteria bacterium]